MSMQAINSRLASIKGTIARFENMNPSMVSNDSSFSRALNSQIEEQGKATTVREPSAQEIAAAIAEGPVKESAFANASPLDQLSSLLSNGSMGSKANPIGSTSATTATGNAFFPNNIAPNTSFGQAVISVASKELGQDYVWGGESRSEGGFDCSGLVQHVYGQLGIKMPRVARDQAKLGVKVNSIEEAVPGDLLTFGDPAHHIGIYAGNGEWIEAPRTGLQVRRHKLNRKITDIRRVVPSGVTVSQVPQQSAKRGTLAGIQATGATAANPLLNAIANLAGPSFANSLSTSIPTQNIYGASPSLAASNTATKGLYSTSGPVSGRMVKTESGLAPIMTNRTSRSNVGVGASAYGATPESIKVFNAVQAAAQASNDPEYKAATNPYDTVQNVPYADLFNKAGRMYGLSPRMLAAIAQTESDFRPTLTSHAGAVGVMQLMPVTAREVGVPINQRTIPSVNIDGASHYIAKYFAKQPNVSVGLAAYNAGPGAVRRAGGVPNYQETKNYVRKVREYMDRIS